MLISFINPWTTFISLIKHCNYLYDKINSNELCRISSWPRCRLFNFTKSHHSYDIWWSLRLIAAEVTSPSNESHAPPHQSESLFYILGGIVVLAIVLIFLYVVRKRIKRPAQMMTVATNEKQGSLRNEKSITSKTTTLWIICFIKRYMCLCCVFLFVIN